MKQKIETKLIIIIGLIVLLLIPIFMIQNLIDERSELQQQVQADIAKSSSDEQQVIGPFIHAQYLETVTVDGKTSEQLMNMTLLPESLNVSSNLATFEKYRGIYKALLYRSQNQFEGRFKTSALAVLADKKIKRLNLILAISDIRGIGQGSHINVNERSYELLPGTQLDQLPQGIRVELDYETIRKSEVLPYQIGLNLQGMRQLSFAPVGKNSSLTMQADWPHPSFVGDYLPIESSITAQDFSASWQTNYFATNLKELFNQCLFRNECTLFKQRNMGVNLVDSVNHYLKNYRASNYAILVIVLIFASFFLLEVLRDEPIHPVQYGFVGLALAVFYLLLISLSEHLGFNIAYLLSALASAILLSVYVAGMLKNSKHGGLFLCGVLFLYSLLYGLLSAEDYALLMGSVLVFVVLSLIMMLTRRVNWYGRHAQDDETN
ncbi:MULTISPECIES: cell envelope integrity protein CreD [unclassified Pseudoalteromonas]|uniref:cell envelope integrity protein CreD n=1 Tax=unclassified Pseudoalteromonas TaxID=194690 RepID=UPI000C078D9A|nr:MULTISPECIES: cell envelope integrity protein CreD [unclassified Pseudoalteromonas]MDB2356334.1 cell envelope integrity protein CreD [Pseudoalteromonas sp.]MDP2633591.1 cell envelope integrity protein CreD [Pseudoalteromonas sp. 1_MG-2023]PHN90393.1 cell envelope integrity protein CreD [Pseudoalteromonas sp. 3D05]